MGVTGFDTTRTAENRTAKLALRNRDIHDLTGCGPSRMTERPEKGLALTRFGLFKTCSVEWALRGWCVEECHKSEQVVV